MPSLSVAPDFVGRPGSELGQLYFLASTVLQRHTTGTSDSPGQVLGRIPFVKSTYIADGLYCRVKVRAASTSIKIYNSSSSWCRLTNVISISWQEHSKTTHTWSVYLNRRPGVIGYTNWTRLNHPIISLESYRADLATTSERYQVDYSTLKSLGLPRNLQPTSC